MKNLVVSVADIGVQGYHLDAAVPAKDVQPDWAGPLPLDSFDVTGDLVEVGDVFLFRGSMIGDFEGTCDRCLERAQMPFDIDVTWTFEEGPLRHYLEGLGEAGEEGDDLEDAPEEVKTYQHGVIDLRPHLWEELQFAVPSKFVCEEACEGLCSICGQNKNLALCKCEAEEAEKARGHAGFAGLAEMFPDLPRTKDDKE